MKLLKYPLVQIYGNIQSLMDEVQWISQMNCWKTATRNENDLKGMDREIKIHGKVLGCLLFE